MLAELGHLMTVTSLANVRLGIIPLAVLQRPMWTVESFNVFDDATIHVELLSAQVTVTVPGEIVVYLRAFDQLARLAVYGAEARSLISTAISDLSLTADWSASSRKSVHGKTSGQAACYHDV